MTTKYVILTEILNAMCLSLSRQNKLQTPETAIAKAEAVMSNAVAVFSLGSSNEVAEDRI